jgi:CubicO group peptidase (beta-lactamase class C family)
MINIRFLIYTAVIFLLSFDHTNAQSLSQNDQKELNQLLHMQAAAQDIPGMVIMVANKKKVIYKSAVGFNSISNRDTLLIDDIFNIASMTKAITSVVIMQLYEQGRIGLDDEAKKYLPEIGGMEVISNFNTTDTSFTTRPVVHPITIRQLLTHTSGIGYPFCNDTLALISQKKKTRSLAIPIWIFLCYTSRVFTGPME